MGGGIEDESIASEGEVSTERPRHRLSLADRERCSRQLGGAELCLFEILLRRTPNVGKAFDVGSAQALDRCPLGTSAGFGREWGVSIAEYGPNLVERARWNGVRVLGILYAGYKHGIRRKCQAGQEVSSHGMTSTAECLTPRQDEHGIQNAAIRSDDFRRPHEVGVVGIERFSRIARELRSDAVD